VLVSDDGSPCTYDAVLARVGAIEGVRVIRNRRNCGIGRALNQGLQDAREHDHPWLLTVDQDSSVDAAYAPSIVEYAQSLVDLEVPVGAVGAGQVHDASGPLTYPTQQLRSGTAAILVTEEVIQSGSVWFVPALSQTGGFDESLGMDALDAAACLALRAIGRVVVIDPSAVIAHEIEGAQQFTVLGKEFMVTGHSAKRKRAIVRNRLRLFPREFAQSPKHAVRTVRRGLVNVLGVPLRNRNSRK